MNDFTKEDLLEIYGLLEHHYSDPQLCFNPNPKLLIKIQSMIDNYCDHELEDWALMDNNQKICIKCENIIHGD